MAKLITVYLLRHGQAQGGDTFRGSTNDSLTEKGYAQMVKSIDPLLNKIDGIVSSPLMRCAEFAKKTAHLHTIPMQLESGFREIHFGEWEGKTYKQIDNNALKNYYQNPYKNAPNHAEPLQQFEQRIGHAWQNTINRAFKNNQQHVLIVCHAGVIRALLKQLLGLSFNNAFNVAIQHGCLLQFTVTNDAFTQLITLGNP